MVNEATFTIERQRTPVTVGGSRALAALLMPGAEIVPGRRATGVGLQRCLVMPVGRREITRLLAKRTQTQLCVHVPGIERLDRLIRGARTGHVTERAQHLPQVDLRLKVLWRVPQQRPVAVGRLFRLAVRGECIAEIEQGVRIDNPVHVVQCERRAIAGNGLIQPPGVAQHIRQVVMEHGLARPQGERTPDANGCTRQITGRLRNQTEQMQGIRLLRIALENFAIQCLGRHQLAGLVLTHGGREQVGNGGLLSHLIKEQHLSRAGKKAVSWKMISVRT